MEQVKKAARIVSIDEFIETELDDGYETVLGELIGNILNEEDLDYSRLVDIEKIEAGAGVALLYWLPDDHLELSERFGDDEAVVLVNVLSGELV